MQILVITIKGFDLNRVTFQHFKFRAKNDYTCVRGTVTKSFSTQLLAMQQNGTNVKNTFYLKEFP